MSADRPTLPGICAACGHYDQHLDSLVHTCPDCYWDRVITEGRAAHRHGARLLAGCLALVWQGAGFLPAAVATIVIIASTIYLVGS